MCDIINHPTQMNYREVAIKAAGLHSYNGRKLSFTLLIIRSLCRCLKTQNRKTDLVGSTQTFISALKINFAKVGWLPPYLLTFVVRESWLMHPYHKGF